MAEENRTKMRLQWRLHKLMWKLSGGRLGRSVIGMPVLELVTTGHKSGEPREILITYVEHDGAPHIIGTNAGRDVDPAWVKNLRADPTARMRIAGRWSDVAGTELADGGDEHAAVWELAVAANDGYQQYRSSLTRPIPIIRLDER